MSKIPEFLLNINSSLIATAVVNPLVCGCHLNRPALVAYGEIAIGRISTRFITDDTMPVLSQMISQ